MKFVCGRCISDTSMTKVWGLKCMSSRNRIRRVRNMDHCEHSSLPYKLAYIDYGDWNVMNMYDAF